MKREEDEWLDRALEDSFPASDPFSPHQVRPADGRPPDALEPMVTYRQRTREEARFGDRAAACGLSQIERRMK